jgi:hypothetical protein
MNSASSFFHGIKNHPALLAFFSVASLISALYFAFDPLWETSDDVHMSMIAHGYGIAAYASPNLLYSNVLWGYLVGAIPTIHGVMGYSLATLSAVLLVGWAIMYFLLRLGTNYALSLLAVVLIISRPALIPQFTLNAGLLTVAAIAGWQVYARVGGMQNLLLACLFALLGFLIRDSAFFLVIGVALPLIPWETLRNQKQMQVAFLLLGLAIASAVIFDRWSYGGVEWQQFRELNAVRVPYTDYGAGEHLKHHPEIIARHGYSPNDIDLISNWFFVDPKIADPKALSDMLSELGPLYMQDGSIQSGLSSIESLAETKLLPLLVAAIFLSLLIPCRTISLIWILCFIALFSIGVLGRPSVLRIYVPVLSLLLITPLIFDHTTNKFKQYGIAVVLFLACTANIYFFAPSLQTSNKWSQQIQKELRASPIKSLVAWGAGYGVSNNPGYPFIFAHPVLSTDQSAKKIQLYALNSFTLAPYSIGINQQNAGTLLEKLQSNEGIQIMAGAKKVEALRIYCKEHLNGKLHQFISTQTTLPVMMLRCE